MMTILMANENDQNTESTDAKPAPKKTTTRRKTTRKSTTPKKTTKAAVTTEDAAGEAAPKKKTTRRKSSTSTTRTKKADAETVGDATGDAAPKKKTTRRKSSTSTRAKKATTEEAVEAAPAGEAAPKKKTTRRRAPRKKAEDTVEASASGEAAPRKKRSTTTGRKSARASEPTVLDSVDESSVGSSGGDTEAAPIKKTSTRRKSSTTSSTRTRKPSTAKKAEAVEAAPAEEAAPAKKKTTRRKSTTSTRAKKATTEEAVEAAPAEEAAPKRRTTTRPKKKPASKPVPAKKISALAADFLANFSSRGSSKPAAEAQEDIEIPVIAIPDHPESDEPEELIAQGTAWLDGLFVAMGLEIKAAGSFDEGADKANFNLTGEDLSRILGPSNASPKILETVEKVLSVFFEQAGFRNVNVLVDCDGFRSKQAVRIEQVGETLVALSEELGSELLIAGLNDFERRIIHRQIGEGRGLVTESTGYGSFRKLHLRPE
jgi:predicted RNA-binding protein Jag